MQIPTRLRNQPASRLSPQWPMILACGVALWAMRGALARRAPAGTDVAGHLARLDWGLSQIVGQGRLDGWYPRAMLGYQEFLVYPPGFTWLVQAVRVATFGAVGADTALTILTVTAYAAMVPAATYLARSMSVAPAGAISVGVLALAVSSPRGGGIEGMFVTGLATQHVAMPLALVTLGALARAVQRPTRESVIIGSCAGAGVLLVSPVTAVLVGFVAPLVLIGATLIQGRLPTRDAALAVVVSGAGTAGLASLWLVPFLVHHDVRGYITSWDQPTLTEHLRLVLTGQRGAPPLLAAIIVGSIALVGTLGAVRRSLPMATIAALGPVALAGAHGLQRLVGHRSGIGNQLTNRGLTLYLVLALLPVGWLVGWLVARGGVTTVTTRAAPVAAAAVALLALGPLLPHVRPGPDRTAALLATAQHLQDQVAPSARFVVLGEAASHVGVAAPAQWLIRASGRNALNPFSAEGAPGSHLAARVAAADPVRTDVDRWAEQARSLAVTHVVTTNAKHQAALTASDRVRLSFAQPPLAVFTLVATPGRPVGSLLDVADSPLSQSIDQDGLSVHYRLSSPTTATVAIAWSPRWSASIDGSPHTVHRTADALVAVELPAGTHRLDLRLRRDAADVLGRALSTVSVAALLFVARPGRRVGAAHPVRLSPLQ